MALDAPKSMVSKLQPNTVRVFELLPGSDSTPIEGNLHLTRLEPEHIPYEALSYAWGSSELCKTVTCNSSAVSVTENLYRILLQLRRSDVGRFLWVDAICIDQGSDDDALQERSHQITLMNDIFAKASRVIVDLGETTEDFDHLIMMLEQYTILEENPTSDIATDNITVPGSELSDLSDLRLWRQFLIFIQLPWFRRLWCFQEFILAREIITMVGSRVVAHFDLHRGIISALIRFEEASLKADLSPLYDETRDYGRFIKRIFSLIVRKQGTREFQQARKPLLLEGVLLAGRTLETTDPRDRFYAIYALLPSNITISFCVDYSESVQAQQQRLSVHLIQKHYGMWVLFFAIGPNPHLPTWTRSLSTDEELYWAQDNFALCSGSARDFASTTGGTTFCAGGTESHHIVLDPGLRLISIDGHLFDSIVSLTTYIPPVREGEQENRFEETAYALTSIWEWADANGVPEDTLWRLLVFDSYGPMRHDERYRDRDSRDVALRTSHQSLKEHIRRLLEESYADIDDVLTHFNPCRLYLQQVWAATPLMRLAMTGKGFFAAVPYTAEIGDTITVFRGVPAPFVLRGGNNAQYQLIGPCYVHGLMEGQALEREDWKPEGVTIV